VPRPSPKESVSMKGVRLATQDQLKKVTDHSLGVGLTKLTNDVQPSGLAAAFGPWVDFYAVIRTGPEWSEIKDKRAIAFAYQDQFRGIDMALYWRRAPKSHGA
ncbi:MAG: hypothetical protein ACMG6S_06710, partial [Byssovorax sp.]